MKTLDQLTEDLENIQGKLAKLNVDAAPLRKKLGEFDRNRSALVQAKQEVEAQIADLKKAPRVSDHAVIRFLERKHGFDFEKVRESLLTPTVIEAMNIGAEGVKVEGGTLKIRSKCITTFIGNGANAGTKPKKQRKSVMSTAEEVWGVSGAA